MLQTLIPLLGSLLDRIFPDPQAAAAAKVQVMEMAQRGELAQLDADLKLATGQMDVNRAEAASGDPFSSRWRPFIGWVCGIGCAWNWIGLPVAAFILAALGHPVALRPADISEMMPLLLGMLGIGTMRSFDKLKGTAK